MYSYLVVLLLPISFLTDIVTYWILSYWCNFLKNNANHEFWTLKKIKTACAIKIIPYQKIVYYPSFYLILVKVSIIHSCSCYFNFINTPSKKSDTLNVRYPCYNVHLKAFKSCINQIYWFSVYLTNCTKNFWVLKEI